MDEKYLKNALQLAEIRRGFCAPNPSVGAVVVKEGKILASGYHWAAGSPHAEVEALTVAAENAKGATLYVTLEPCCIWGRTPPCTQLIIESGIKEVFFAYRDPNPEVCGKGSLKLESAGIPCKQVSVPEIDEFYSSYTYWCKEKRPWVTAKLAMTMDGKIAGIGGKGLAISGAELNAFTHQKRKSSDAILTSEKTVRLDNPRMNARLGEQTIPKPLYILDSMLLLEPSAQVFQTAERLKVFYGLEADSGRIPPLLEKGVECVQVDSGEGGLRLKQVIEKIGADGIQDLWVEVGGMVFQSLHDQGLINQAYFYICPKWLGEDAQPAFKDEVPLFSTAARLSWRAFGRDALCEVRW